METSAAIGSVLLHLAGATLGLVCPPLPDLAVRPVRIGWTDGTGKAMNRSEFDWNSGRLQLPQILMAGAGGPGPGYARPDGPQPVHGDTGCATQPPLDREAEPAFPLFGHEGPFAARRPTPFSPVFCVRIGANGRILSATLASGSGDRDADRALARTLRGLRFHPATRAGHAVPAWYRIAINPGGHDWLIDPNPDNVPVEPVEMLTGDAPILVD